MAPLNVTIEVLAANSMLTSRGQVLVRCAICEQDRALVNSHEAADRLLAAHLSDCPGPGTSDGP